MNEYERVTEENLYAKYKHAFDFAKKVIESSSTIPIVIAIKGGDEILQKAILAAHYSRALRLTHGVYKLCLCGNADEAKVLLRSQLNLEINLRWLGHQNDEERRTRMERFAEFEAIYKKRTIDTLFKYNRTPPGFSKDDSFYKELDEKVETIRLKYSLTDERQMDKWSGRSIYGKKNCFQRI